MKRRALKSLRKSMKATLQNKTKKKFGARIGPNVKQKIPTSGLKEDLGWTFSDGVSDEIDHGSVDIDNASNQQTIKYDESDLADNKNKMKKSSKKSKERSKNRDKKKSDPSLEFYKNNKRSISNSSLHDASKGSTPKFIKDKISREYKESPSSSLKKKNKRFIENSVENEGGSISTMLKNNPEYLSYSSSIGRNLDHIKTEKGLEMYLKLNDINNNPHSPEKKTNPFALKHKHGKSVPRGEKYRTWVISPRIQDKDYNAEIYDNSAFERNYSSNEISFGDFRKPKQE